MDKADFSKLKENYNGLLDLAKGLRSKHMNDKPVFSNCPETLKNFATKFTTLVTSLKTSLSFDFLEEQRKTRSKDLGTDNSQNIVTITDWIISALKDVITKVEHHGEILTVHTEALASPQDSK